MDYLIHDRVAQLGLCCTWKGNLEKVYERNGAGDSNYYCSAFGVSEQLCLVERA